MANHCCGHFDECPATYTNLSVGSTLLLVGTWCERNDSSLSRRHKSGITRTDQTTSQWEGPVPGQSVISQKWMETEIKKNPHQIYVFFTNHHKNSAHRTPALASHSRRCMAAQGGKDEGDLDGFLEPPRSEPSFFFRLSKYQQKVIQHIEDRPRYGMAVQCLGKQSINIIKQVSELSLGLRMY